MRPSEIARAARPSEATYRQWKMAGVIIWVLVGAGILAIGARQVLELLIGALSAFLIAGLIVVLTRPFVHYMVRKGMNRALAAALGTLAALAVIVGLAVFFLGPIVDGAVQLGQMLQADAPKFAAWASDAASRLQALPESMKAGVQNAAEALGQALAQMGESLVKFLFGSLTSILSLGFSCFMGLILTFWFLMDGPKLSGHMYNVVPARWRDDAREIAQAFNASFSGYLIGTAINASVLFILCGTGFSVIGLPGAWFLASLIGVLDVIPFVGPIAAGVIAVLVGATISPMTALWALVIVIVAEQFTDSFLSPIVMGRAVSIHPVAIIFSLAIGVAVGGFFGAIMAIPTAAAIKTVYLYFRDERPKKMRPGDQAMPIEVEPVPEAG